jgi:hypothetical protein
MTAKTAEDRLRYARQYASILMVRSIDPTTGLSASASNDAKAADILQLPPNKRIHVMKALSCLARFTGRAEQWLQIREQYQLSWSTGTEKIDAFTRFFDSEKSLDVMIDWLKEAMQSLSKTRRTAKYSNLLLFCTLTGMRGSEVVESVRLLNCLPVANSVNGHRYFKSATSSQYYNPERQILQHYLYPQIFVKSTKAIYISVVNEQIIGIAKTLDKTPTLTGLKRAITNRRLSMHIKYCRKIHASFLKQSGIETEIINMLQGRIGKDIFLRHYYSPNNNFKDRVLDAVVSLEKEIK